MSDDHPADADVDALHNRMGRALRHEIGDFLQKVYATVGILQARLPASAAPERDLLQTLYTRGKACRVLLDTVHDYFAPMPLRLGPVNVHELTTEAARSVEGAESAMQWASISAIAPQVIGDASRLTQVARIFLANSLEAGATRVTVDARSVPEGNRIEWSFHDDGTGIKPDPNKPHPPPFTAFSMTRPGHLGLGLAFAEKIIRLHQGTVSAGNAPHGGFIVRVSLPRWSGEGIESDLGGR